MKCKYPYSQRNFKTGVTQQFRCGKCLPCRIRKRSQWSLRLQLESWHSISKSFWSLTLDDHSLMVASEERRRATIRNFFAALRDYERRKGNTAPIRYFGCLEFGGQFARPHWHFLIFNLQASYQEPVKYRDGLPRPRIHISQWPYGHIDVAEYNQATTNYVTEYLTDFEGLKSGDPGLTPVPFRTILPAIGFYGLKRQALLTAKNHSMLCEKPTYFKLGERCYPIDKWTRDTFMKIYLQNGGVYRPSGTPLSRHVFQLEQQAEIVACTPAYVVQAEEDKERQLYEAKARKAAEREAREHLTSQIYDERRRKKQISINRSLCDDQKTGGPPAKNS